VRLSLDKSQTAANETALLFKGDFEIIFPLRRGARGDQKKYLILLVTSSNSEKKSPNQCKPARGVSYQGASTN
jgi:hypothetical protein